MLHGVAKYRIFDRECLNFQPGCRIVYTGHQDCLHLLNSSTGAGDEIGWDYVTNASHTQTSLSAYCIITSAKYYGSATPFMSRQLFTKWIFSWMGSFQKDFRKQCPVCGPNPKILACDGTKIGIFLKNADVTPIETPTCDRVVRPLHKRTQRQFFAYCDTDTKEEKESKNRAKKDLGYFVAKYTNYLQEWKKTAKESSDTRTEEERQKSVLTFIPEELVEIFQQYTTFGYPHALIHALSPVMRILATDCPITSLVNFRFMATLESVVRKDETVDVIRTEIANLLDVASTTSEYTSVSEFLLHLVHRAKVVHENDDPYPSGAEIVESYNPTKQGRAFYFTEHGGRLRDLPRYEITKEKERTTLTCRKQYQDAMKSGTSYLFLWFCPVHGHCYGFHLITGSEGRKDPASSAFLYMETPPSEVFYDFSCQLKEYSLNREPSFWRNCRFHHDIFHGFSHKCPFVYKSSRVPSLHAGINSEICEQFNSFIQKIKFSARSMNQQHFIFYVQFFIDIWNERKKRSLETIEKTATELLL